MYSPKEDGSILNVFGGEMHSQCIQDILAFDELNILNFWNSAQVNHYQMMFIELGASRETQSHFALVFTGRRIKDTCSL